MDLFACTGGTYCICHQFTEGDLCVKVKFPVYLTHQIKMFNVLPPLLLSLSSGQFSDHVFLFLVLDKY